MNRNEEPSDAGPGTLVENHSARRSDKGSGLVGGKVMVDGRGSDMGMIVNVGSVLLMLMIGSVVSVLKRETKT